MKIYDYDLYNVLLYDYDSWFISQLVRDIYHLVGACLPIARRLMYHIWRVP